MGEKKTCPFKSGSAHIVNTATVIMARVFEQPYPERTIELGVEMDACTPDCALWVQSTTEDGYCGLLGTKQAIIDHAEHRLKTARDDYREDYGEEAPRMTDRDCSRRTPRELEQRVKAGLMSEHEFQECLDPDGYIPNPRFWLDSLDHKQRGTTVRPRVQAYIEAQRASQ